ncbi:sporulation membrane protein YtrI [Lentibacillus saliphilus]|uniref:sporulation membrane protein YtrI n=1 Tax=Lentibacillus saliphilus TaxID=2737028 RepID=UPI001C300620|nr:sporulation membrane protein YtrI [Lentibacillus saliphilus]
MYIPPHFKKTSWQHAVISAIFGGIVAYGIIMFMYGTMYEQLIEENLRLEARISELKAQNNSLKDDKEDQDHQKEEQLTIQSIDVSLSNSKELHLDRLTIYQLVELVKTELDHVIGQDFESVSKNAQLLISTIENKTFTVDDMDYYLEVQRITFAPNISLVLKVKRHQ